MSAIYFATASLPGLTKVGYTRDLGRRLQRLRAESPASISLDGTLPVETDTHRKDGIAIERRFHERYLPWHSHGEWFHWNPLLASDLIAINAGSFDVLSLPTELSEASLLRVIRRGPRTRKPADATSIAA